MDFNQAFRRVVGTEGGYVNDPQDPGGETKYGISKRAYPLENIRALTLTRAKYLYRRDYWNPCCTSLPYALRYDMFDAAVNHGNRAAIRILQRAVGEYDDGILGPLTLQAVQTVEPHRLLARFNGYRLLAYIESDNWARYGRGWTRRVANNLITV